MIGINSFFFFFISSFRWACFVCQTCPVSPVSVPCRRSRGHIKAPCMHLGDPFHATKAQLSATIRILPRAGHSSFVCMYVCMFAHFRPRSCYIQIYNKLSFVLLGLFLFLPGHALYCRTMKQEMMMYMYCTYLGHLQNARCQWKQDRYEITVAQ